MHKWNNSNNHFFDWQQERFDIKDNPYNQFFIITSTDYWTFRTFHPSLHESVAVKTGVLRNFATFTGKHLCQRLFKSLSQENFAKFLRTPFLQNTSGQLLQNGHAKILIAHILYRRTTPEEYLEPSRTYTMEPFCKKKPSAILSKTFYSRYLTGF